jgi:hypothetical protein
MREVRKGSVVELTELQTSPSVAARLDDRCPARQRNQRRGHKRLSANVRFAAIRRARFPCGRHVDGRRMRVGFPDWLP